jgi:hypothetical protein
MILHYDKITEIIHSNLFYILSFILFYMTPDVYGPLGLKIFTSKKEIDEKLFVDAMKIHLFG